MKFCALCGTQVSSEQRFCPRCGYEAFSVTPPADAPATPRRERWTGGAPQDWHALASMLAEDVDDPTLVADLDLDAPQAQDDDTRSEHRKKIVILVAAVLGVLLLAMAVGYAIS